MSIRALKRLLQASFMLSGGKARTSVNVAVQPFIALRTSLRRNVDGLALMMKFLAQLLENLIRMESVPKFPALNVAPT